MPTNVIEFCRIGQKDRCKDTGCEWKKVFNHYCNLRPPEVKIKIAVSKKDKIKEGDNFIDEIKIPSQDDWIKKIKTI